MGGNDDNDEQNSKEVHETFCQNDENQSDVHKNEYEIDRTHNQTSMFLNKYCENTDLPTVANRVADIIVEFEKVDHFNFFGANV